MNIDIATLQKLRNQQASMIQYYADREDKRAQNAALIAAGLKPLHSESQLQWDMDQAAQYRRNVACLDAVLEHLGEQVEVAA